MLHNELRRNLFIELEFGKMLWRSGAVTGGKIINVWSEMQEDKGR